MILEKYLGNIYAFLTPFNLKCIISTDGNRRKMKRDLFEIADAFFLAHPEYVTMDFQTAAYGANDNPFIRSAQIEEKGFRTISEKLVLLLTRHAHSVIESILVSPHRAAKVVLPGSNAEDLHRHHYFELFGVLDGQLDMRMEHMNKRYLSGDFCLINQNVFHSEVYSGDFSAIYISFRPDFFEDLMSCKESDRYETLTQFARRNNDRDGEEDSLDFSPVRNDMAGINIERMNAILSAILEELLYRQAGYMDIVIGNLKRLFAHMQHTDNYSCVNTRYAAEKKSVYHDTLAYIHRHRRKLSRNELAAALNYNSNYLADIFRKNMGISLSAYIRDTCMQEAATLLLNTELPIHEIINSIGYENRTVFYRHFQEKYHVTPKEYRELPEIIHHEA